MSNQGGILTPAKARSGACFAKTRRNYHGLYLVDCKMPTVGGGGGPAWAPPSISGNILQFVADLDVYSDSGLTTPQITNSGLVQGWKDQSASVKPLITGSGGSLVLASMGPNNRNGVYFDPSGAGRRSLFTSGSMSNISTGSYTLIAVWSSAADTAGFSAILSFDNGSGGSLYHQNSTRIATWFGGNLQSSADYLATQPLTISTFRRNGTTCEYWKDGTADAANPQTNASAASNGVSVGLGSDSSGNSSGPKTVCAAFLFDNSISDLDRIALHTYLGTYYGITMGGA